MWEASLQVNKLFDWENHSPPLPPHPRGEVEGDRQRAESRLPPKMSGDGVDCLHLVFTRCSRLLNTQICLINTLSSDIHSSLDLWKKTPDMRTNVGKIGTILEIYLLKKISPAAALKTLTAEQMRRKCCQRLFLHLHKIPLCFCRLR